ncbi:AMP-binding protein [Streptomyces mirabilis]|uniref:AMP-binding protein n=1 Tax=Streptomyces mirabilis TaxID=68239 RepID=UPI00367C64B7
MTDILTDIPAVPTESVPADGNLSVRLEQLARHKGWLDRTAYLQGTHRYSYGEVYDRVRRTAGALRRLGVRREDRVLLALPDSVAFVVTFLAVLRIGAVAVPVNTFFHADELRSSEEIAEASLVVSDAALQKEFRGRSVTPRELTESYGPADDDVDTGGAPEPLTSDAPAFAVFTSGTTGAPGISDLHRAGHHRGAGLAHAGRVPVGPGARRGCAVPSRRRDLAPYAAGGGRTDHIGDRITGP